MTSKLKCPVCQHKLYQTASEPATYCCLYKDCPSDFKFAGSKEIWQALIQAKRDLRIARKALSHAKWWLGSNCIATADKIIDEAIGQTEHKE